MPPETLSDLALKLVISSSKIDTIQSFVGVDVPEADHVNREYRKVDATLYMALDLLESLGASVDEATREYYMAEFCDPRLWPGQKEAVLKAKRA